ncbi:response regulator transcription factor [Blautia schinkii]|nr:response regulator transcription factor [Blautia schinkii]
MSRILVIEDEHKIQEILVEFLQEYGFETDSAYNGVEGLAMFQKSSYDLVLLDIMMPKIDGFATLELLRKDSDVPVIIITAMEEEEQQMKGFDLQADDYIVKPFSMNLVIRRIEAVLRRKQRGTNSAEDAAPILVHKNVMMDTQACEVRVSGTITPFTYKEYELLKLLLENKNRVFTRDDLLRIVWGYDFVGDERVVNNHIMRIRKKLGEDFITTVRGMGYRIDG